MCDRETMPVFVLIVAAVLVGTWALRPMGIGATVAGLAYRLLIGLFICSAGILAVGSVSLRSVEAGIWGVALVGFGYELFLGRRRNRDARQSEPESPPTGLFEYICACAVVCALALALVSALAPVTGWDACVAHAALAVDYAREGRIAVSPGNAYSAYPHLAHALYAAAFVLGGETGI